MKDKQVMTIIFPVDMIKTIDEYRYSRHIPTRSEAIRYLIEYALEQNPEYKGGK